MTTSSTVAIVGSGIAGTTIAHLLTQRGVDVSIFEFGPEYPYPHREQFSQHVLYLYDDHAYDLPPDLKSTEQTGAYPIPLNNERITHVGGMATRWSAWTPRMLPKDFKTKSLFGYGRDWPLTYDELEPYYCQAEALLGISGTDADNPFAPWRSKPYPLPPFEMAYDDLVLAERLKRQGILIHTAAQARTRQPYGDRPGCTNFGACGVCPIGARYSPNHHLELALKTGRCKLYPRSPVTRIVASSGRTCTTLVYHPDYQAQEVEHHAKLFVVAAGGIASARLLLNSTDNHEPNGLGNQTGQVGRNFMLSHIRFSKFTYKDPLYGGRVGPRTCHSYQFSDPPERSRHGGIKVDFPSVMASLEFGRDPDGGFGRSNYRLDPVTWRSGAQLVDAMRQKVPYQRIVATLPETIATSHKYVTLSERRDRFGMPQPHVHYALCDFDHESTAFAKKIHHQFAAATEAIDAVSSDVFLSGHHHLGTCRMGEDRDETVADSYGRVHDHPNLYLAGGSLFPSCPAFNPTLTIVALAIRTTAHLAETLARR